MNTANIICLDTETGGLFCRKNPITQVALQSFQLDTLTEISRFDSYIKPYNGMELEQKALDVTGITLMKLQASGKEIKEVVGLLVEEFSKANAGNSGFKKAILLGHNITFDIGFICYAFNYCKVDISKYLDCKEDAWGNKVPTYLDTMWDSRKKWANDASMTKYNLTACCEKAGIEITDAHSAQNDVTATKALFIYLLNNLRTGGATSKESEEARFRQTFQF